MFERMRNTLPQFLLEHHGSTIIGTSSISSFENSDVPLLDSRWQDDQAVRPYLSSLSSLKTTQLDLML